MKAILVHIFCMPGLFHSENLVALSVVSITTIHHNEAENSVITLHIQPCSHFGKSLKLHLLLLAIFKRRKAINKTSNKKYHHMFCSILFSISLYFHYINEYGHVCCHDVDLFAFL